MFEGTGDRKGLATPWRPHNREQILALAVHGDDVANLNTRATFEWRETALVETFQIAIRGPLGDALGCCKDVRALNRLVRLAPEGLRRGMQTYWRGPWG